MTLEKVNELIAMHTGLGSGSSLDAVKLLLGEVHRDHGQYTVDQIIRKFELEALWQIKPGTNFAAQESGS